MFTQCELQLGPSFKSNIDSIKEISKSASKLSLETAVPKLPNLDVSYDNTLKTVQETLNSLGYNFIGIQFYFVDHKAPLRKHFTVAKRMIAYLLPIKCLEATILAIYLTHNVKEITRFTLSFTSKFGKMTARHVVLGIYSNGKFGALGLSRKPDLMDKPLLFSNLYHLIKEYEDCYRGHGHKLKLVKIGNAIPHEAHIMQGIPWRGAVFSFGKSTLDSQSIPIIKHGLVIRQSRELIKLRN
ncbi:Tubulinyl-Tyr carboxypeptidase 2 [Cichlidogyrus casuarinus]|uniref:Tubulinyl-Tyr carboxypeptidase 2 n=1 Tax=Cichlidogyrus casuarinus TaxID=1844966 RepID=A0ABD2QDK9_9PLAT